MIVKDRDPKNERGVRLKAGANVEHDVAFYLRREFTNDKDVFVVNDLRLTLNGETAQIDHLIIYKKGFIIVESKSIRGEVKVNGQKEWSRTVRGKWTGMPSPIEQAKLQTKLLKALLNDNAEQLLGKMIVMQQYFGGRCWDQLCAVSNDALIDRSDIPSSISKKLVKAESIGSKITALIKRHKAGVIFNTNPSFTRDEMYKIMHFLSAEHKPSSQAEKALLSVEKATTTTKPEPIQEIKPDVTSSVTTNGFACKKCGNMKNTNTHVE